MSQVSIIVPVYNAEPYLHRCIDSIVVQTFSNFEVILVDDGSTDQSGAICDEYAAKDNRFKVIHQQNGGVSAARQTGLDFATGNYVIHADSDDWVESNWLQCLYEEAVHSGADIVVCDLDKIYKTKTVIMCENPFAENNKDLVLQLLSGKMWGGCYNKLVRREIFERYNIRFVPNMSMWEDLYVSCQLFMNPVKVTYVPTVLYHYDFRTNMDSLSKKMDERRVDSAILFVNLLEPQLSSAKYSDLWYQRKAIVKRWALRAGYRGRRLKELFPEINERLINEAKDAHIWSDTFSVSLFLRGFPIKGTIFYQLTKVAGFIKRIVL